MKEILLRKSDQLNGATRDYFERLKAWLAQENKETFMNREVRTHLRIKGTTLRRYHHNLLDAGLIRVTDGKKATGFRYEVVSPDEYEQLKQSIETVLEEVLEKCRRATAPGVSHSQNGPLNGKKTSKIKPVSQPIKKDQPS
jgi:predicted transcriptional regulator